MQINELTSEMRRTTVSFEDSQYETLEKWAEKEVRTVPNLITAIVVSVLRGESPQPPKLDSDKNEDKQDD